MKFSLIVFIVMLIATHQCAFGNKHKGSTKKSKDRSIFSSVSNIFDKIPGISTLTDTVEKISNIKNEIKPVFDDLQKLIENGLNDSSVASMLKNDTIQLDLVGAKDTKVGKLIQVISDNLKKGITVARKVIANVNQTLGHLTEAAHDFVNNGLGKVKPSSQCSTAISQARNNYTIALIGYAKLCVEDALNLINQHLEKVDALQLEINLSIQTGKVRVKIFADITEEGIAIKMDISKILKQLATCEMDGLKKSLATFSQYYFSASVSCIGSIFGK